MPLFVFAILEPLLLFDWIQEKRVSMGGMLEASEISDLVFVTLRLKPEEATADAPT